jgi:hypothetical protein
MMSVLATQIKDMIIVDVLVFFLAEKVLKSMTSIPFDSIAFRLSIY